jgi:Fic family protein
MRKAVARSGGWRDASSGLTRPQDSASLLRGLGRPDKFLFVRLHIYSTESHTCGIVLPKLNELTNRLLDNDRLRYALAAPIPGEYIHWDKLRRLKPPDGLSHEEWWWAIKWGRRPLLREFPLTDPDGRPFTYALPDEVLRSLHYTDQRGAGEIAVQRVVTGDDQARQHYLVNSLMEEAIRSSQLEGAATSKRVAKELLRTGREPRNRSERMILNNYQALQFMREIGDNLTPEVVLELQRILTDGTLQNPDAAGRLQRPDEERIAVFDTTDDTLVHTPPPAEQLSGRLEQLCRFANATDDPERFMHPVVRAILLHFWLGYDHPFEDGNGRTARALFYWSMRTQGYWLTEYLSISGILRKAPGQYMRSFMQTEADDRDTTYFLIYHLSVIHRAVDDLQKYLQKKTREVAEVENSIKRSLDFNHRQLSLLSDALRNPDRRYTFLSHATSHNVTHETSRRDLLALEQQGLLERRRGGRRAIFTVPPDLSKKLTTAA